MTDTGPPAELDDVVVTGQRRKDPHEPFPQRPEPVVWEGQHAEKLPGMDEAPDPCADPETALEWNADAAAAEAAKEFARRAEARIPPETLNTREWGVLSLSRNGRLYSAWSYHLWSPLFEWRRGLCRSFGCGHHPFDNRRFRPQSQWR
jgi:hypothetical protein